MNKIEKIVLHCSDSTWGDALIIDQWHKQRGWKMIGYHNVITNGKPHSGVYWSFLNGAIQTGRPLDNDPYLEQNEKGAHVKLYNSTSIGICLIGKDRFTQRQYQNANRIIVQYLNAFGLSVDDVLGHYELDEKKTCPNFSMDKFREDLRYYINVRNCYSGGKR